MFWDDYRDRDREREEDHTPRCVEPGCTYLAVAGAHCGLHRGQQLADRYGGRDHQPGDKAKERRPMNELLNAIRNAGDR